MSAYPTYQELDFPARWCGCLDIALHTSGVRWSGHRRNPLHLDNAKKQILQELTQAITDTVTKSERIAKIVYRARAAGFDVELKLDGTIDLSSWSAQALNVEGHHFLTSMHLRVNLDDAISA